MINNSCNVCATSTLISSLIGSSLPHKCIGSEGKFNQNSLGCVTRRNLIPSQMRSLQTDKGLQSIWIQQNLRIIKHLSSFLKSSIENVIKFLFNLTLSNYSKVLNGKTIVSNSSCGVPLMHNNNCETYLTIFDQNGNIRDPLGPQSLFNLFKVMQILLNRFSENRNERFHKTLFEIIGGKTPGLKKETDCFGGCDPTGIFRQRKTHTFYSIDGRLRNLNASDLIGYGANIVSSSDLLDQLGKARHKRLGCDNNSPGATTRERFGPDGIAGQMDFGAGERGGVPGGRGVQGYGPDGQNGSEPDERGGRLARGMPGYGPDGPDSFGTGERGGRLGGQNGFGGREGQGYGPDGQNGFETGERGGRIGRGMPGYGPEGENTFGTGGRGEQQGGQNGFGGRGGQGYGTDGQDTFGTGERGGRLGRGKPGYASDDQDTVGTGGRGGRQGGKNGFSGREGQGYRADGQDTFGTGERGGRLGRGMPGHEPDGQDTAGTGGIGGRHGGKNGRGGSDYGTDGQNSSGVRGRQGSQNLFGADEKGREGYKDGLNAHKNKGKSNQRHTIIKPLMSNLKNERNSEGKNVTKLSQSGIEILNVLKDANRGELVTNNDEELLEAVKTMKLNRLDTEKDTVKENIKRISNHYESQAGKRGNRKFQTQPSINEFENIKRVKVSHYNPTPIPPDNTSSKYKRTDKNYLGEALPVLFHEPFNEDKPWTWIRRHPKQVRITDKGNITRGNIHRYRRDSVEKKYQKAKQRMSIQSTISAISTKSGSSHQWHTFPKTKVEANKSPKRKKISTKYTF